MIKERIKKVIQFILNPRLILCLGIAWMITNGWAYVVLGIGTIFEITWMIAVGSGYIALLWLPISPEKILTVAIAIALLHAIFPNDTKTLGVLRELSEKVKLKKKSKDPEK
ncbi:MAG: hypothetical protein E7672_01875 [Ruminococcaceae bacterium]|nr:hypothetical protein [Oscillospiraceae bacterium]